MHPDKANSSMPELLTTYCELTAACLALPRKTANGRIAEQIQCERMVGHTEVIRGHKFSLTLNFRIARDTGGIPRMTRRITDPVNRLRSIYV